jgi:hypothetical protein
LRRLINIRQPTCRVRYEFEERGGKLRAILTQLLTKKAAGGPIVRGSR